MPRVAAKPRTATTIFALRISETARFRPGVFKTDGVGLTIIRGVLAKFGFGKRAAGFPTALSVAAIIIALGKPEKSQRLLPRGVPQSGRAGVRGVLKEISIAVRQSV